ncbi:hypothetical protein LX32DRAFT_302522 [Colletotrichum zoysiae]|uniref:Uncharacterized protein n=1 Tax=Colletotrichum zoysiae TaxID=1216348 RepID=A0AAD9HML7_9PEZI|nr:hypothetical protein LX32DRAFT_302522 [Colletotrichum zoysiae]
MVIADGQSCFIHFVHSPHPNIHPLTPLTLLPALSRECKYLLLLILLLLLLLRLKGTTGPAAWVSAFDLASPALSAPPGVRSHARCRSETGCSQVITCYLVAFAPSSVCSFRNASDMLHAGLSHRNAGLALSTQSSISHRRTIRCLAVAQRYTPIREGNEGGLWGETHPTHRVSRQQGPRLLALSEFQTPNSTAHSRRDLNKRHTLAATHKPWARRREGINVPPRPAATYCMSRRHEPVKLVSEKQTELR